MKSEAEVQAYLDGVKASEKISPSNSPQEMKLNAMIDALVWVLSE